MEDRGGYAVVGGELGDLRVGAFGDDIAGDEAGGIGVVELIEGMDGGFVLGSGHEFGANRGCLCATEVGFGLRIGVLSVVSGSAESRGWGRGRGGV